MYNYLLTFVFIAFCTVQTHSQTNSYKGQFAGDNINGSLTFNKDETVTGNFSYTSSSSRIYKISGTNFVKGEIEVTISYLGKRIGSGTLNKTISDTHIIWEGEITSIDEEKSNFLFKRPR